MKHGSLQNEFAGSSTAIPEVGMGITVVQYTDRDAGTITRVGKSGKEFWYKLDTATRTDSNGMSESQEYTFTPDDSGDEFHVKLSRSVKHPGWKDDSGHKIIIGERDKYHDYSF